MKSAAGACWLSVVLLASSARIGGAAEAKAPPVRDDTQLEAFLAESAKIQIDLPALGYAWNDQDLHGDAEQGSLAVENNKVVYYFLHWGPIEVPKITEAYVRQRIPKIWPSEGLEVRKVEPRTVAGHPAYYAEVLPKRGFYRAHFLVWNCEQSGRQFIADMNYNVSVKTPRKELQAELDATEKTLACHPGAPTTTLENHAIHYDNPRYRIRFDHPAHWFVFDNPYGVPHPAYEGLRNHQVGSILAWLQDMEVRMRFEWQEGPESAKEAREAMGINIDLYRLAVRKATELGGIDDFSSEEHETLRVGEISVLKVGGTAIRAKPKSKGLDQSPKARTMMLVAKSPKDGRELVISLQIDFHREDGLFVPPDRSILDNWAVTLSKNLRF
jgi:hypothetical protein